MNANCYLKANFQMEFTSSSNDVLTGFFNNTLHHRIGLGQSFQTFDLKDANVKIW